MEENNTVNVPLDREELHITRNANPDTTVDADVDTFGEDETIVIPLTQEKVKIDKETVVTGEVNIDKTTSIENQEVSENVRCEVIDVE